MAFNHHFPENGWETIHRNWSAWWAGELPRSLVVLECIDAEDDTSPHYASTFLGNYGLDTLVDELLDLFTHRLETTHYLGDAFPRFWPNFGPGIVGAFSGAELHPEKNTTWFSPAPSGPISDFHIKFQENNPWWQRVKAVTQLAVERWGNQLSIGFTDLGGNLDILAHLLGTQQVLLDLVDHPEQLDRLVHETHILWLQCYQNLYQIIRQGQGITCWGPCWSSTPGYLLQSDFSFMISPAMYARFVLPEIARCCEALDFPFYHLDGKGQLAHLDMLLSLDRLRGIQWVPGDGQPQAEH